MRFFPPGETRVRRRGSPPGVTSAGFGFVGPRREGSFPPGETEGRCVGLRRTRFPPEVPLTGDFRGEALVATVKEWMFGMTIVLRNMQ